MAAAPDVSRRSLLEAGMGAMVVSEGRSAGAARPNIVLIVADDLGFGDLGCYGATRIPTPNLDRLAAQGRRFTNAHATSAVCTPSRYSLLTGEYPWRRPGTWILPGDAALIIEPGRATLPELLRRVGYRTAVVGKWHLGLGGPDGPDWNGTIAPGPLDVGFDRCFIMPATCDRVPCVYVDGRKVANLDPADPIEVSYKSRVGDWPTGREHPELLKMRSSHGHDQTIVNGIGRIGYMTGGRSALWVDEDMADTFTRYAVDFIGSSAGEPFFLYFATHDPHVPRVPHPRFVGKSRCGPRGDAIVQFDWCVGEVMATLERLGLARNTILLVTSDNGPVVDDGYADGSVEHLGDHSPAGPLRGGKYSNFEGGTRIPFVVNWPGRVRPGVSDALVSLMDLPASLGAVAGSRPRAGEASDSRDVSGALFGRATRGRPELVEQGGALSLLRGSEKVIEACPGPRYAALTDTELGNAPEPQLYDLAADLGEKEDLAARKPVTVADLLARLARTRAQTRR